MLLRGAELHPTSYFRLNDATGSDRGGPTRSRQRHDTVDAPATEFNTTLA